MSTTIQNRNASYAKRKDVLARSERRIFQIFLKEGFTSSYEVSEKYGIKINKVVGRVNTLVELCLLRVAGSVFNQETKMPNTVYAVTSVEDRIRLANEKYAEITNKKDQLINDLNLNLSDLTRINVLNKSIRINNHISKLEQILKVKNIEVIDPETVDANA